MAVRSYNGRDLMAGLNGNFESAPVFVAATTTTSRWIDGTAAGSVVNDIYKWNFVKDAGTVSGQFDSSEKNSGSYSIKVDATDATGRGRVVFGSNAGTGATLTVLNLSTYAIQVQPSTVYRLTYFVKSTALAGQGQISVHQHNSSGVRSTINQPAGFVTGTVGWTLKTGTFRTDNATKYLVLSAELATAGIQTIWFDDISLTEVLPARTTATRTAITQPRVATRDMGTALRFDGVDDFVSFTPITVPFFSAQGTFSCWVKRASAGDICLIGHDQTAFKFFIWQNTGRFVLETDTNNDAATSQVVNIDFDYHHVVITGTLGAIKMYVDGVQISTTDSTITNDVTFGRIGRASTSLPMNGLLDEPRIWNRALTAAEIANMYFNNIVPRNGLVAEYLFNEASGSTALDTSGNGNNGTITGATYTTDVPYTLRNSI